MWTLKNQLSGQLHRRSPRPYRRFIRCIDLASASGSIAPTYSTSITSVQPVKPEFLVCSKSMHRRMYFSQRRLIRCQVHCTNEYNLLIIGLTGDSKLSSSWSFRLGFLHGLFNSCPLDRRGSGLAMPIFSLSSLEPKSLRMVILTIILVQVLCCLYQSPKHYIEIWHERSFSLHL